VAAQDVDGARLVVARYWRRFPAGTVHLVVVDPGVGAARAAIAVESEERYLVGPDNGVLSPALLHAGARCVEIPVPAGAAPTFHGRDLFAPAAAALAEGTPLDSVGTLYTSPLIRRTPEAVRRDDGSIAGEVITVDRFGNAVTNLVSWRGGTVEVNGRRLSIVRAYADVDFGSAAALVGSSGLVEIAVRDGNAATLLGLARGNEVVLRPA
jgi:S-adenosylmethionine hydrolase